MANTDWKTKPISVASLHLDIRNPRLGRETTARAPREIIQYLFENDKALDIAESIARRGYFPNEPLLAVKEGNQHVVIEGNRRLAALKALREPALLDGSFERKVERFARMLGNPAQIAKVPVTIAPNRRSTDQLVAGRHIGTPVLAWQAENRASFILEKISEGYSNDELREHLGFTLGDIQAARQTRAIADMARSLDLPEEVRAKLDRPRTNFYTTLDRVFSSTAGQNYLMVEKDPENGIRGKTTKKEFLRGFEKLVTDVALGKESSRTLNKNEDIEEYFKRWKSTERPRKKRGSFTPADIITGKSVASSGSTRRERRAKKPPKRESKTVLPKTFHVRVGADRLVDIRRELVRMKREDYPNAGAVLLRVFLELAIVDYLDRTGELATLKTTLKEKKIPMPFDTPSMKYLAPAIMKIAKRKLPQAEAKSVEKAITYNATAPFTVSDLHSFVHQKNEWPSERDIQQFWMRTESLFRMMLEEDIEEIEEEE